MGLKACETVTLKFNQTPAERLGDEDFDYSAFLDLGQLMWCALAIGTCEAVKITVFVMQMSVWHLVSLFRIVRVSLL